MRSHKHATTKPIPIPEPIPEPRISKKKPQRQIQIQRPIKCSECSYDIEPYDKIILECGHVFHKHCVEPMNNCPVCSQKIEKYYFSKKLKNRKKLIKKLSKKSIKNYVIGLWF